MVGVGRNRETLSLAEQRGAITSATTDISEGVADAQLSVVCTPVDSIVKMVEQVSRYGPHDALITDVGSTKSAIVRGIEGAGCKSGSFVGSHPMAGGERTGPTAASDDLFVKRTVVVTPTDGTRSDDIAEISNFWKSLGASVHLMSPEEHDIGVAITSHVPHLVAAALAASTPMDLKYLVGRGWRDGTRVASGSLDVWEPIIAQNRTPIANGLATLIDQLERFRSAIERNDSEEIESLLSEGKQRRDALGS